MRRTINISVYAVLFVLVPALTFAGEGVDVAFSVQTVQIQDLMKSRLSHTARWSFKAESMNDGLSIVDADFAVGANENEMLPPGSLVKLFVTAAILEQNSRKAIDLGTMIAINGAIKDGTLDGDIIIKGAGNPFLSIKDLNDGVHAILSLGIRAINGNVIIDDSLFDVKGWKSRYRGAAYGIPSALGLDLHTTSITADGAQKRAVISPQNDTVKVSFSPSGSPGIRQIDDATYEVTGVVPDMPIVRSRFSLADPALYAGGAFLTLLKKQGISISGTVKRGTAYSSPGAADKGEERQQFREIARIGPRNISTVSEDTNEESLNVAADNLLLLLGALVHGTPGTREKGIRAVDAFLREMNVPVTGMVVDDGSGVSEQNKVSAQQLVSFLRAVAQKTWFTEFYKSLSRPGMDGRLKEFRYRTDRRHMKSGQLRDAYCLAGYVDRQDGKKIAFAYMVNGLGLDIPAAQAMAIDVLRHLEGK